MTRLLMIRHAPTPETGSKLTGRLPGVSLGDAGVAAAQQTAARLSDVKIAAIYTSPIERTTETAGHIAHGRNIEPIVDEGLIEIDFGDWSGRSLASLYKLKAWKVVQTAPSAVRFPNGESFVEAQARAVSACRHIADRHRRKIVAAISHADVIKLITSHALGQPIDLFQRIAITPSSVTVIDMPTGAPARVVAVNTNGDPETWL